MGDFWRHLFKKELMTNLAAYTNTFERCWIPSVEVLPVFHIYIYGEIRHY